MSEQISIATPDGSFNAYLARPATTPAASVVVIQEIFGVNADVRETCDTLASLGYYALAPDLFWRVQPGVDLNDQTEEQWKQAMALKKAFDIDKGVDDITAAMAAARALPGATGKVGVIGFCLGGLMTFLSAVRGHPDAAAAYYGGGTHNYLGEFRNLSCPLIMHLAEADEFIAAEARAAIIASASGNPKAQVYTYPGQNHAFARHHGKHYDATAATLANERTWAFLAQHLRR